jgi:hypothetical protein
MSIPCWLTNRDTLTPVRGMVEFLLTCDDVGPITIVDCASTYPPLIDWYRTNCPARVIFAENLGNHAPWRYVEPSDGYYFASDADFDLTGVPRDFLRVLREGLIEFPEIRKTALSLRIDDLPDDSPLSKSVITHESQFWQRCRNGQWFEADVDTTVAMYRGREGWGGYGPALRSAHPYTARHIPWYLTRDTCTEEWEWYFRHLDPKGITWGPRLRDRLLV